MPKSSNVINGKGISDSSKKLYLSNLKRLNNGVDPTNYKFLEDTKAIEDRIEKYSTNTKRTYYISIVNYLPEKNKLRKFYYDKMMEINKAGRENTEKSDKQKLNWITQDEVNAIWEKLGLEAEPLLKKRTLDAIQSKLLQSYIILSLFVLQPPRRSLDYTQMVVVPSYNESMDKAYNYFDLKNKMFHFCNYKTAGTYKTQNVPVSDKLYTLLKKYRKSGLLLQNNDKALTSPDITRVLNKIFDKKVSVNMLRNIFFSSKYSDESKELSDDATATGTSVLNALNTYIKKD